MAEKIPTRKPQEEIEKVIQERTFANPGARSEAIRELDKNSLTALDLFAFPAEITENEEAFLEWFEPRFFPLRGKQDFQHFAQICQQAVKIILEYPFLLSPKIGENTALSAVVLKKIQDERNLQSLEQVLALFRKVSVENVPENLRKIFCPERKSASGAEKLSVCRVLSIAYVLEISRQSQDFKKFLEYARFVLGENRENLNESGLLSTLIMRGEEIKLLQEPAQDFQLLNWLEKGQVFQKCSLNNIGDQRSFYLPEVHIGTKSGLRAFLKILRDPTAELKMLDDFFRMRFVFDDRTSNREMVELLSQLEKEAGKKKEIITKIEFREKGYFSEEEKTEYFSKEEGAVPLVSNMKMDKNPNSGAGFRNISAKIKLFHPGEEKKFFAFEIQLLRKKELEKNEKTGMLSDHFALMIRQGMELLSRFNGKLTKEEIVEKLKQYLETIETEKMPDQLTGKKLTEEKPKQFSKSFSGSLKEKSQILFDFLVEEGTLQKVAADFPSFSKPAPYKKHESNFFIHRAVKEKILKKMGIRQ